MKKIVTIHPVLSVQKYGYETTQLSRQKVAEMLNVGYLHIMEYPQIRPNWRQALINIGFKEENLLCVPHYFSDIGHDKLSVRKENLKETGEIKLNEDGFVEMVSNEHFNYYYTSGLFLKENKKTGVKTWFNKDGSVALYGKEFNPKYEPSPVETIRTSYVYSLNGEQLNSENLLLKVLLKNVTNGDLIIRDQHREPYYKIVKFMNNTGKNYYEYIHSNIYVEGFLNIKNKQRYLVASENLTKKMANEGFNTKFLAPIGIEPSVDLEKTYSSITDFCFVGNNYNHKRPELVIKAFIDLYNKGSKAEVTFYGEITPHLINYLISVENELTPNIHFKGFRENIPWKKHQAYISSSISELFANACVEAMNNGLITVLSNVDIAHKYYAENNSSCLLFEDSNELVDKILYLEHNSISNEDNLEKVKKYNFENLKEEYRKLLEVTN